MFILFAMCIPRPLSSQSRILLHPIIYYVYYPVILISSPYIQRKREAC